MSTTLKLSPDLKRRVAGLARESGLSPHGFMVEAIRQQTEQVEQRRDFVRSALTARGELLDSGRSYDWAEVQAFYRARLQGRKAARPRLRK